MLLLIAQKAGKIIELIRFILSHKHKKAFVTYMLEGSAFKAAVVTAVLGQASTLINAGIAIIGGVALFTVLEKPFGKILNK